MRIRLNILSFPRFSLLHGALAAFLVLLSALEQRVVRANVTPYSGQPVRDRPVAWRGGKLASDYKVEPQDVIELTVGDNFTISVIRPNSLVLNDAATTVSFAHWVGVQYDYLVLQISDRKSKSVKHEANLCFADNGCPVSATSIKLAGKSFAVELVKALSGIGIIGVRVIPKEPGILMAGDVVNTNLTYTYKLPHILKATDPLIVQSIDETSTVDYDGQLRVPRMGFVLGTIAQTESDRQEDCNDDKACVWAMDRAAIANLEKSLARVRVLDGPGGAPFPLWEVERCLNAITWMKSKSTVDTDKRKRCLSMGVDSRFMPDINSNQSLQWQRYDLQVGPRKWYLIDVSGDSYELPYPYGLSVQEGVVLNYRRLTGKQLGLDSYPYVYASVYSADGKLGLYAQLALGEQGGLWNLGLSPGDRVFLTHFEPTP